MATSDLDQQNPQTLFRADGLFWLLALSAGLGQGSLHILMPALGAIAQDLGVTFGVAQLTVSVPMMAMAVSTLVIGPVGDMFGRKPVMIGGLVLFLIGAGMSAMAPTATILILARALQGVGGVATLIVGRTVMRDLYQGAMATKAISYLLIGQVIGPAMSPILGSLILIWGNWRGIFWLVLSAALALLVIAIVKMPETRPPLTGSSTRFWEKVQIVIVNPRFWAPALTGAISMSMLFAILTTGSWAVSQKYNLSPGYYAGFMLIFSTFFVISNTVSARLVERFGPIRMMTIGVGGLLCFVTSAWVVLQSDVPLWVYLLPCPIFALSNGAIIANSMSLAIEAGRAATNTASGFVVFCQLSLGAVVSQLVGARLPMSGLLTLNIALTIAAVTVVICLLATRRLHCPTPG